MTPYHDSGIAEKRQAHALRVYNGLHPEHQDAVKKQVESFQARCKLKGMKQIPGFESTLDLFMALGTFCNEHGIITNEREK